MKKKLLSVICTVVAMLMTCTVFLAGCFGGGKSKDTPPKEYTIQYTDESGAHMITVTDGMPYSLDVVPMKTGYDFMGLYDAEVGGTQYISASGSSLAPFTDKKNLVLFPQYKAKDYTVILDYQGVPVTGSRQLTVTYGSSLPELPKNLTGDHKEFVGWYTEAACGGTQIADEYGLIPLVSVLNEQNFDLSSSSVTLYAGFEMEKHTVTFCFETGMNTEDMQVAYDTPISQVVPKTRVNGNAVLTWSKTQGGEVFNGKVTTDMVLYAVEYAPVIEFDSNGGKEVTPIVARAGSTIALPTPTKDMAKFSYWEDMSGNKYNSTTMPTKSTTLKAVWQAKLVFDSNGGSDVDDISEKAGTSITLPTPEREGFIFAGWYTSDKEVFERNTMPATGTKLKAGWYKAKNVSKVLVDANNSVQSISYKDIFMDELTLNFSEYLPSTFDGLVSVIVKWKEKNTDASQNYSKVVAVGFYSQRAVSDDYIIARSYYEHTHINDVELEESFTVNLIGNVIYVTLASSSNSTGWLYNGYISDFRYELTYPDTANLYL